MKIIQYYLILFIRVLRYGPGFLGLPLADSLPHPVLEVNHRLVEELDVVRLTVQRLDVVG